MQRFKIEQKVQPVEMKVEPIAEVQKQKTEQRLYDLFGSSDEESQNQKSRQLDGYLDDGYYIPRIGSQINGYQINAISGKGEFALVAKASKAG